MIIIVLVFMKKNIYLLLGFGVSNKNVYKFLKNKYKKILIYDDNYQILITKHPKLENIIMQSFDKIPWDQIKIIVVSAGIKPAHQALQHAKKLNIEILTDLDILYKYKKPGDLFIGITGSNGKTTTVTMISFLLTLIKIPNLLCGNIGLSLFKSVRKIKKHRIYIIEISSYQSHYICHIKFDIGVITNISSNHEEWHQGLDNYIAAKNKLLDLSQINNRDNYVNVWSINHKNVLLYGNNFVLFMTNKHIITPHNKENLILALWTVEQICKICDINYLFISNFHKLNNFKGVEYRQEIIYEDNNLTIVNDSKSSNITSTAAAINHFASYQKPLWVMMGGLLKGDFLQLPFIKVTGFILFGPAANLLKDFLIQSKYNNIIQVFDTLAITMTNLLLQDILILSPGGGSFDEFKDYKDRGKFFNQKIKEILAKQKLLL